MAIEQLNGGESERDKMARLQQLITEFNRLSRAQQDNLLILRSKTNKLLSGAATRNLRVCLYGSSVDRGVDEGAVPYSYQYSHSTSFWMAKRLQQLGYAAGANNLWGTGGPSPADLKNRDSRFTYPGTAPGTGTMSVPGGLSMTFAAGVSMAITFPDNVNQYDLYGMDYHNTTTTWTANVDGGANTNVTTTGADKYHDVVSVTAGAVGQHTLNLAYSTGGWFVGVDAYDNTRNQISIWQHACAGFSTFDIMRENGAPAGGRETFARKFVPDAGGGTLGLTNSWRFGRGAINAANDIDAFMKIQLSVGSVPFFVTPPFDGGNLGDTAIQDDYVKAAIQATLDNGGVLIDWRTGTRSYAASQSTAAGLLGDATHLTANNGAVDFARAIVAGLGF